MELLTASQAARELGISHQRVFQLLRAGAIVGGRLGNGPKAPWTITRAELDAYRTRRAAQAQAVLDRLGL